MPLNFNDINDDNINVDFKLTPIFNDGMLQEADLTDFLDQIGNTLMFLNPISAKLYDLYFYDDGEFIFDPILYKESALERKFMQILTINKSFVISAVLSGSEYDYLELIPSFMESMSNDDDRFAISWQFDVDTLDKLCDFSDITSTTLDAVSFTFGNLINNNRFVTHLNDLGSKFNSEHVTSNCNIIKDVVIENKGTINVQFKINYYDPVTSAYQDKRCKLAIQPDSVTEIITSLNEGIEFYFKLKFPPKLYNDDDDHSIAWPEDAIISAEKIGKSNTFMIKIKTDSSDYREYARVLKVMYSNFFEKFHHFVFSPISTYCVDYSDRLFDNNFPFEVKYALECITSLSYAFKDDLYINGTQESFYNFIDSKLDDGQEKLLTEVLYQLFQQIVFGKVTNTFADFVALFHVLKNDINTYERSVNRDHQLVKRIILTPTRTLYLPPTPSRTKFMIERVNLNSMIIVYFRDDDKSYTMCGQFSILGYDIAGKDFTQFLDDVRFRTDFIKRVVQKRLFKEHGFISAQALRYLGTSISQIFLNGILVQANTESS